MQVQGHPSTKATAFYARVTRDESLQKGLSIPNQRRRFEEIAHEKGWAHTLLFLEEKAISGEYGPERRPALQRLLETVRSGQIERVVIRHSDRLGRGSVLEQILNELHGAGVEVLTFDSPIEFGTAAGRFQLRVQAAVGAFEVERGGERVREARRSRALQGVHIGPAPFGYTSQARRRRELTNIHDDPERARVEAQEEIPVSPGIIIDKAEAKVVREIYRLYTQEQMSTQAIAAHFNEQGLRRRGGHWFPQTVRKILRDPKVAGWVTYDESAYRAKRKSSAPIHRQARYEATHEPIIDRATWDRAQYIMDSRAAHMNLPRRTNNRVYPLTSTMVCINGHRMAGKSSGQAGPRYYTCTRRARCGSNPEIGCDAPIINADRAEALVRAVLQDLFTAPDKVIHTWEAAQQKFREDAPERIQRTREIDDQIAKLKRQRAGVFSAFENTDLPPEQAQAIAERVTEINADIKALEAQKGDLDDKVISLRTRTITQEQVATYLGELEEKLAGNPEGFRELVQRLHQHHDLRVEVHSPYQVAVSLALAPGQVGGGGTTPTASAQAMYRLLGVAEDRHLTNGDWVEQENEKGHHCTCGCGERIVIRSQHRSKGIPSFIHGHHRMDMTEFVQSLNGEGWLTVSQAARELSIGENTLRRAEAKGWVAPEWRTWGEREPMRIYRRADLPKLREQMIEAGFRFKETGWLTAPQVAQKLSVALTTLRKWERDGLIPTARRDSANKRAYTKSL